MSNIISYFLFSGKILETLSPKHHPSSHHRLNPLSLTVRPPPSPPSQPPTPPRTPLSPPHHKSSNSPLPPQHAQQQQMSASAQSSRSSPQMAQQSHNQHGEHQAAAVYESLRHKMANSMAKLAGLPPESIIGNPRVRYNNDFHAFVTRSCKNAPISFVLSVCPFVCLSAYQLLNGEMDFHEMRYWRVVLKFYSLFQIWLKSVYSNGHFTWTPRRFCF
jgi:hypothetical protein